MLRTSNYTIYVGLPGHEDEMLLVHGYNGAYDLVSRRVADYLQSREVEPSPRRVVEPPSAATITVLRERGYLTRFSPEEEESLFVRFVERLHESWARRMPSYLFMPTYDCNLRCTYCFQDDLRTDPARRSLLRVMRPETVDRIFAAMPEIEARQGVNVAKRRREIGFFGGEPLLAVHRPLVEYVMQKARQLGDADFWAVTNGTELDAFRELLGRGKISRLQITLDGPPDVHDRRRVHADGSGTFAGIARNLTSALELGTRISLRVNVDGGNVDRLPALADEIRARGWNRWDGFAAYAAPIRDCGGPGNVAGLSPWQLDQAVTRLRREHASMALIGRPDEAIRNRVLRIFDVEDVLPRFRPSFCGAHDRMVLFDPFGHLYACWEKTGDPAIRIGEIGSGGQLVLRSDTLVRWRSRTVARSDVCRRCRYALYCGGGCAVLAEKAGDGFDAHYCDGFAGRFQTSVAEAYLRHVAGQRPDVRRELVCDR